MDYELLWRVHAILMGAALLGIVLGVFISLLFKNKSWRYKMHRFLGILSALFGVSAVGVAVYMIQISHGAHMGFRHAYWGAVAAFSLIMAPLIASQYKSRPARKFHKLIGYIAIGLMGYTAWSGIDMTGLLQFDKNNVTPVTASEEEIDNLQSEGSLRASGIKFSWVIKNGYIDGTLEAETQGWVAVGFNSEQMMKDYDFVIGYVSNGQTFIRDHYGKTFISHVADIALEGGRNDIEILGGEERENKTIIRFRKPLRSDDGADYSFVEGQTVSLVLAYGARDDFTSMYRGYGKAFTQF